MPANLTAANGFYPVQPNNIGNTSVYHGELLVEGTVNITVAPSVQKVYLGLGAGGAVRVDQDNVTIHGIDDHALEQLTIGGKNVSVVNATVSELIFPRTAYTKMVLAHINVTHPVRFSPHAGAESVNLDSSTVTNVVGNVLSLLHPSGTIEINGATEVIVLPCPIIMGFAAGFAITGNATSTLNVAELTGIFGKDYLTEYEAGDLVLEALEATQLAQALILPTVLAVLSVVFAWGDRLYT